MDDLIPRVGAVDRSMALKALATWVDLGVLKEDTENSFRLLEIAEEAAPGTRTGVARQGISLPKCALGQNLTVSSSQLPSMSRHQLQAYSNSKLSKCEFIGE